MSDFPIGVLYNIGIISFVALSAYVLLLSGEVSFGQQAYFAMGAYAAGMVTAMLGWHLVPALLAGAIVGALAAAAQNWALRRNTSLERLGWLLAGLLLVFPSLLEGLAERITGFDLPHPAPFGLALATLILLKQKFVPARVVASVEQRSKK